MNIKKSNPQIIIELNKTTNLYIKNIIIMALSSKTKARLQKCFMVINLSYNHYDNKSCKKENLITTTPPTTSEHKSELILNLE